MLLVGCYMEDKNRTTVTVPEDVRDLFNWVLRNEPGFEGSPAKVAAYYLRKGLFAAYEESLKQATPLEPEVEEALSAHSIRALTKASGE